MISAFLAFGVGACSDDAEEIYGGECDVSNCDGCCEAGTCYAGTARDACGTSGKACTACPDYQVCSEAGSCYADCGPDNCVGCCDEEGECRPGDKAAACGDAGEQCSVCGGPSFPDATTCYELDLSTHYCTSV